MNRRSIAVFLMSAAGGVLLSFAGSFTQSNAASKPAAKPAAKRVAKPAPKPRKILVQQPKPVAMGSKIVPIFSVGQGMRVGVARVTGPAARAKEVLAVGQVETVIMDAARVRIFVPVKTEKGFDRVPQTNVDAYADLRL